jgi:hypothetical protein
MACRSCENGWLDETTEKKKPCRPCHRRAKNVQAYAEELASWMGLTDWTLQVLTDSPSEETSMAEIDCIYGQRLGKIALSDDWDSYKPETQRDTLVHELVHAILAPYSQMADDMLDALVSATQAAPAKAALSNVEEWITDAVALAWGQHLPLPKGAR